MSYVERLKTFELSNITGNFLLSLLSCLARPRGLVRSSWYQGTVEPTHLTCELCKSLFFFSWQLVGLMLVVTLGCIWTDAPKLRGDRSQQTKLVLTIASRQSLSRYLNLLLHNRRLPLRGRWRRITLFALWSNCICCCKCNCTFVVSCSSKGRK